MANREGSRVDSRTEKTKEFVVYERLFHNNKPSLRRVAGNLVMPKGVQKVMGFFQRPKPYGIRILDASIYIQNDDEIFVPEEESMANVSDAYRIRLDSIVLAHSFKTEDMRDKETKENSACVAIQTESAKGVVVGDISYVPTFKGITGSEEDIPALEKHLQRNGFIALYDFENPSLDALFKQEKHWDHERYKKPHCIIVNTSTITSYGFQKRK